MRKRLIILESEKNNILEMYGLIVEQTDEEILNYADKYINTHNCDDIANDMEKIKNTDTYTNLSKEDQNTFDDAINGLNHPSLACGIKGIKFNPVKKGSACNALKEYMKKEFRKQLPLKRDIIISQICAFSYLWTTEPPLNGCQKTKSDNVNVPVNTNKNQTVTDVQTGGNTQTQTNVQTNTEKPTNQNPNVTQDKKPVPIIKKDETKNKNDVGTGKEYNINLIDF